MSPIISRIGSSGTTNSTTGLNIKRRKGLRQIPFFIDFLVAAGGGGGVNSVGGGGGGAGGYLSSISGELSGGNSSPLAPISALSGAASTYLISVGGGGTGTSGADSSISLSGVPLVTAKGGGYDGGIGGSAAGGSINRGVSLGLAVANQGFNGSTGGASVSVPVPEPHWICPINPAHSKCVGWYPGMTTTTYDGGGGGGGAGSAGTSNSSSNGGNGGNGIASAITGSSTYRCGGGGGFAGTNGSNGSNGLGTGTANSGGGGGSGASGSSGVVYLRIPASIQPSSVTGNPNEINVGEYIVYEFTGSGSITF